MRSAVLAACLLPAAAWAQAAAPPLFAPAGRLPFDPAVTIGTLPNGLRYYIRRNTQPEKRVNLQLAVRAGSINEADDEQGLAHVVEHMAFSGSRHFKPGELIAAFESAGARLGPHASAYTAFNETVYTLTLPADSDAVVREGLQALSDFAGGLTLAADEIEQQRGVVMKEWRGGPGAGSRLRDRQIPVLYYKSKYAERAPIGTLDVLRTFTRDRLRAFYSKWYRPDRMALIVVGDIDAVRIEAAIRREFAVLQQPGAAPPAQVYDVPLHKDLLVSVSIDPDATQSLVSLARKKTRVTGDRVADYRRDLVDRLVFQMVNERLDEVSQRPDAPFLGAGAYETTLSPTVGTFTLSAGVAAGKLAAGLAGLQIESKRVTQYGFAAAELERARTWMLASYDRAYAERDKTESDAYAQEYVNNFLEHEPSPGIEYEYRLAAALVPAITAADAAAAARALFGDESRVVLASAPPQPGVTVASEAELREALARADAAPVTAWTDVVRSTVLMAQLPEAAPITSTRSVPALGVTIVRFANGVEGWFKPTDFRNDQILFSLAAPGGLSLAPPALYPEAQMAAAQVQQSGAGGHTPLDLHKLLAGRVASASPFMSSSSHGISGSSAPANLETALQLLNMNFTAPGDAAQAYAEIRRQLEAAYANRDHDPYLLFGETIAQTNTGGHFTSRPLTLDRIAALDRSAMAAFYKARFSNAADFTFVMVGAFDPAAAIPLVARYVGSLPSSGQAASAFRDLGVTFPPAIERVTIEKGREPRAQTLLSFFAEPPVDENEQTRLDAAIEVLAIRLRELLGDQPGVTNKVSVALSQPLPQRGGGHLSVAFGAPPANIGTMVDRVLGEVQRLQQDGPPAGLVSSAKDAARRGYETALKQNGFWLSRLQSASLLGRDPLLILQQAQRIDAVTSEGVQQMFRRYFPLDRYTVVTLMPEK